MGLAALEGKLQQVVNEVEGCMGVAVVDVESGEETGVHEDAFFPMASVCKTPILVAAYRQAEAGPLSLDMRLPITRESRTAGSGLLNFMDEGLNPTVRDLLLLMIVVSDNAATDYVLGQIGGPQAVTTAMELLGLTEIRLHRTIRGLLADINAAIDPRTRGVDYHAMEQLLESTPDLKARFKDPEAVRAGIAAATADRDVATPRQLAALYAQIARNACASAESCAAIIKTLERQQLRGRLPRELPPGVRCCHKTGTLGPGTVTNDSGLIFIEERPIAVAVLSRAVVQPPAETNTAIARIGRLVYDHFAPAETRH